MINWDKPVECVYGDVEYVSTNERNTKWVRLDNTEWAVAPNGAPLDSWMPCVYNKKPEPKTNEYWLCESNEFSGQAVLSFHGNHWEGANEEYGLGHITPLYKMERVEG